MPLTLSPMQESDIPAFAAVDAAAMAGWAYAEAMMQPGTDRQKTVVGWTREGWGKDPTAHWLKVTDDETGELIAAALWILLLDGTPAPAAAPQAQKVEGKDEGGVNVGEGGVDGEEGKLEIDKKTEKDINVSSMHLESSRLGREFDAEFVGNVPHARLAILVTHPKHQRRGAGALLIRWGCERADERGIICVLTASQAGLVGYQKQGFEIKKISELDLKPYGYDVVELRRYMIRAPTKAA